MSLKSASQAGALAKGALAVYLQPKLAADAKVDLAPIVSGVTTKNFRTQVPAMVLGLMKATKGKLAQDADIEDVAEVIEALAEILPPEAEADVKAAVEGAEGGEVNDDADAAEACIEMCRKLSPEDREKVIAGCQAMGGGEQAQDEKDDKDKKDKAMDAAIIEARIRKATAGMVSKTALDAALATQAKTFREVEDARRMVRPYVGEIEMAFDSAPAVLRQALTMLNKAHVGKHDDALIDILSTCDKPGDKPKATPRVAQDAAAVTGFAARYPNAARIGHAA